MSLDVTATVGGIDASDEDVLEYDPGAMTWAMVYDGSVQHPTLALADVDAVALPEPGFGMLLGAGVVAILTLAQQRRRRSGRPRHILPQVH